MTDAITLNAARSAPLILESTLKGADRQDTPIARSATPELRPMDEDIVRLLTDAVAGKLLVGPDPGNDRSTPSLPVQLRPATITVHEASVRLTGIMGKLPAILSALIGSQDPAKAEEGAIIRAAEGVTAQGAVRTLIDGTTASSPADGMTGVDADAADRSANAGGWIVSSPFSSLLALLRQLLLKLEKHDRENSAQMVTMQRDITIVAGEKGVEKARENLGGTIGSAVLTGAIGGAAMKQTFKSTSMQTNSIQKNSNVGNNTKIGADTASGGTRSSSTPTEDLRGPRNLDGTMPAPSTGSERAAADLQADLSADRPSVDASLKHTQQKASEDSLQTGHSEYMAKAQIPASQAMMLNMMAPAVGGTIASGVQIEAEMTEAERQLALQVADVFRRIADEQQDQSMRSREMRDAAAQLYESLLNLISATSAHIIQKS